MALPGTVQYLPGIFSSRKKLDPGSLLEYLMHAKSLKLQGAACDR